MRDRASAARVEKALHAYLGKWLSRGEWFLFAPDDHEGAEAYEHGVGAVLSMQLCRGAWQYEEIDWPAYEAEKLAAFESFKASRGAVAKVAKKRSRGSIARRELSSPLKNLGYR